MDSMNESPNSQIFYSTDYTFMRGPGVASSTYTRAGLRLHANIAMSERVHVRAARVRARPVVRRRQLVYRQHSSLAVA